MWNGITQRKNKNNSRINIKKQIKRKTSENFLFYLFFFYFKLYYSVVNLLFAK